MQKVDKFDVFVYRCARLQSFVRNILMSKKVPALVSSVSIGVSNPIHHNAVMNYLFNHDNVGLKSYAAAPLFDDALLIVTQNDFFWLLQNIQDFELINPYVKNLPNHSVFLQNVSDTVKQQGLYFNNCVQMSLREYQYLAKQVNKPLSTNMQHSDDSVVPDAIIFEQSPILARVAFAKLILSNYQVIGFASSSNEEVELVKIIQDLNIKLINVQTQLQQFVFSHVDVGVIPSISKANEQLLRLYNEIQTQIPVKKLVEINESILVQHTNIRQMFTRVFEDFNEDVMIKPSLVKELPMQHYNIIEKTNTVVPGQMIYDVYLSHPVIPIIYRNPIIMENIDGQENKLLQLAGYICHLIETQVFKFICSKIKEAETIETDIINDLKEFLKSKLIETQPTEFLPLIQQTISTLKLMIDNHQLTGQTDKTFGRCISNIQIALQIRKVDASAKNAELLSFFFGRSFLSGPTGFIQIDQFEFENDSTNPFLSLFHNYLNIFVEKQNAALKLNDPSESIIDFTINGLVYTEDNSKQLLVVPFSKQDYSFKSVISFDNFTIKIRPQYMKSFEIYMQNKDSSALWAQLHGVKDKVDPEQQFELILQNRKIVLISENLELLLKYFGNFVSGYFMHSIDAYSESLQKDVNFNRFALVLDYSKSGSWTEVYDFITKTMSKEIKVNYEFDLLFPNYQSYIIEKEPQTKQEIQSLLYYPDLQLLFNPQLKSDYKDKILINAQPAFECNKAVTPSSALLSVVVNQAERAPSSYVNGLLRALKQTLRGQKIIFREVQSEAALAEFASFISSSDLNQVLLVTVTQPNFSDRLMGAAAQHVFKFSQVQIIDQIAFNVNFVGGEPAQILRGAVRYADRNFTKFVVYQQATGAEKLFKPTKNGDPALYFIPTSVQKKQNDKDAAQLYITMDHFIQLAEDIQNSFMPFKDLQLHSFLYFHTPELKLIETTQTIIATTDRVVFDPYLNLRGITNLFKNNTAVNYQIQNVAKKLLEYSQKVCTIAPIARIRFDQFMLEVDANMQFSVELSSHFVSGDQTCQLSEATQSQVLVAESQKTVPKNVCLLTIVSQVSIIVEVVKFYVVPAFEALAVSIKASFTPNEQAQEAEVQQVFNKKEIEWKQIAHIYENEPLPSGWFFDGKSYVNWSCEYSLERPDKELLIERYKRDFLKE